MDATGRKGMTAEMAGETSRPAASGCVRFVKASALLLTVSVLCGWSANSYAAICTSTATGGNWNAAGTWTGCGGGTPGAADTAVIATTGGNAVTANVNVTVGAVVVNANAVLNIGGKNWTVNGTTTISGTIDQTSAAGTANFVGLVTVNAGGTWANSINEAVTFRGGIDNNGSFNTGTGTQTFSTNNQSISGMSLIDFGGIVDVAPGVTVTNSNTSVVTIAGNLTAGNATSFWVNDVNATLNYGGAAAPMGNRGFTASAAGNTVNYTGAAQTVKQPTGSTYFNLILSGSGIKTLPAAPLTVAGDLSLSGTATATAAAALAVGGNLTIAAGATFSAGAFNHSVSGNLDATGTFTAGTSTVTLNGVSAQTISGTTPVTFNNLTVTNVSVPNVTLATNVVVAGALTGTVILTSTCPINYTLTYNGGATVQNSCPGPDHILITHTGNALTCSPQTVMITACADVACTANYSGGAVVTLTPGGQAFAIDATGVNSAATVQQSTVGVVALNAVSVPAATSATPTSCWNTVTATASCAMTFSDSGFLITVPDHASCINATATIEAVETAPGTGRCVPAYQSVTRPVNMYSSYANPVTGTQVVTTSTGTVSTATPGTAHSLIFDATGKATITLNYPDAGQLTLTASDTSPTGAAMTGSGSFVVAPASFVFSGIPAAPLVAGQPFNTTVTAMNGCAIPAATPNFDGTVTLTSSNPLPALGNATAINTTLSGFINGAASLNLTWNEVGTIDLNAVLASYLGSALAVSGTQAAVGRFQPAYFDTVVTPACGTFTYAGSTAPVKAGQPFTVTVTANKLGGGVTANYAGVANAYLTTLSNAGVTTGMANNTITAASFANGVGSANVTYEMATPQTAPQTLALRAENADTPVVSSSGHTESTTAMRSGRANIANAHGLELHALPVPFRTEYWSGGWVFNTADSCTGDGLSGGTVGVTLSAAPVTCVQDTGSPGLSGSGCAAAGPVAQRFKEGGVAGFAGDFNLWLKAPGAGNTGTVIVTGSVPVWLQYPWTGGAAENPAAHATFGIYRGAKEFIDLRESY